MSWKADLKEVNVHIKLVGLYRLKNNKSELVFDFKQNEL